MPGKPARLQESVNLSSMYISTGSPECSPALNAGVGVTGPMIISTPSNALTKSFLIKRLICCAFT